MENNNRPAFRQNHRRKKVCIFCQDKVTEIDYKDIAKLRKFTSERAKILPRRVSGNCALHQRQLTVAIKRARQMALLPYISNELKTDLKQKDTLLCRVSFLYSF